MSGKKRSLCPACGKHASGNFCQHCGGALGGQFCSQCGSELTGEGNFCNKCGAPAGGATDGGASTAGATATRATAKGGASGGASKARRGGGASKSAGDGPPAQGSNLPWWVAGAAMFGLILVVGWNMVQPAGPVGPAGGMPPAAGAVDPNAPPTTDISQMSPRQAADQLFNRVMTAAANGDTVETQGFMPMALQAYEMARPLDLDGLLHLSLLQRTGSQLESSLATALEMLAIEPNHILGLNAAAEAASELGREADATAYYRQLLDAYEVERTRQLPEYVGHSRLLDNARIAAEAYMAGR